MTVTIIESESRIDLEYKINKMIQGKEVVDIKYCAPTSLNTKAYKYIYSVLIIFK